MEVLAWPTVTGDSLGYVLYRFRANLAALIDHIHTLRGPRFEAVMAPGSQELPPHESSEEVFSEIIENYEYQLALASEDVDQLRRDLAFEDLMLDFERIYLRIYESQMTALRTLRGASPSGLTRGSLEPFLRVVKVTYPSVAAVLSFARWIDFSQSDRTRRTMTGRALLYHAARRCLLRLH